MGGSRVPVADETRNRLDHQVLGNKEDAAVTTAGTTASVVAYLKGMIGTQPAVVTKTTGDMSTGFGTGDSPVTLFTVTGDVLVHGFLASTDVAVTSTGGTGTLEVGTSDSTAFLIAQTTADGTNYQIGDIWVDATPLDNIDVMQRSGAPVILSNGADIILTIATADMTAGDLDFYCLWSPLSSDGNVVAA